MVKALVKLCKRCGEEKAITDFAQRSRLLASGEKKKYRRSWCKACESKAAVVRAKKLSPEHKAKVRRDWMTRTFGSVRAARLVLKRKERSINAAKGLTWNGKPKRPSQMVISEERWDKLAAQNARQAFDYWFKVRATDEQIAAWYAGLGRPWSNPRMTAGEKYALRYRLDPEFAAKEKRRATDKRFRFPERSAAWAKNGTRWYRAAASDDGSVDIDALRYLRRIPECVYCGHPISDDERHLDHITPLADGGRHSADNLIPAHGFCNLRKSDTPLLPFMFPEVFRPLEARHG